MRTGRSAFPLGTLSWALKPSHKDVFWTKWALPQWNLGIFISRTLSKDLSLLKCKYVWLAARSTVFGVWILLDDIFPTFKFQAILSYIYFHG